MMVVFKKSGAIRTVIDGHQCNDNTVADITPMPDQEMIRSDLAKACFRSKIDLSDAYEQIQIKPKHESHAIDAQQANSAMKSTKEPHQRDAEMGRPRKNEDNQGLVND
jgi:hypothetical protein